MRLFGLFIVFSFVIQATTIAQTKPCGQVEMQQKILEKNPKLAIEVEQNKKEFQAFYKQYEQDINKNRTAPPVYTIPVVFHILHDYGTENISDAQVHDAIRVLNEDFTKTNADTGAIISAFKPIIGNAEIKFKLAQKDPNGNCTNGINHIYSKETYIGDDGSKINQWPRDKYLNIWTVDSISIGAAGYTFLPIWVHNSPAMDGIIVLSHYVGSIGTSTPQRSRTLTHEVGHWLNLEHTWGGTNNPGLASNCNDDDGVSDTPNTQGTTGGACNLSQNTCNSLDNVQNHMDYSGCSAGMFTKGQTTRMRAAMAAQFAERNKLWTTSNLAATGVLGADVICKAVFGADFTGVCLGKSVQFTDLSYNVPTGWQWSFSNGIPSASNQKNPTIQYLNIGSHEVSLTASNSNGTVSTSQQKFITVWSEVGSYTPVIESFEENELSADKWKIVSEGDPAFTWKQTSSVAHSGNKSLKMNNYGNQSGKYSLETGTYDLSNLSGEAYVKFKVAYPQSNPQRNDKLIFYVSTNCGRTWIPRLVKTGASLATTGVVSGAFSPSGQSDWAEHTVVLTSTFLQEGVRFRFLFESDGGNNLYLDDINIYGNFNPSKVAIKW